MKLSDFEYELPPELIAQEPADKRDESKLLVLNRATGEICHRQFRDIVEFLKPFDCLVLNRTKVIPARIMGNKETGGKAEVLFLEFTPAEERPRLSGGQSVLAKRGDVATNMKGTLGSCQVSSKANQGGLFRALIKPFLPDGKKIVFPGGNSAVIEGRNDVNEALIRVSTPNIIELLEEHGIMPLPLISKDQILCSGKKTKNVIKLFMPMRKALSLLPLPGCISRRNCCR